MPIIDLLFFKDVPPSGLILCSPDTLQYFGHWLGLHLVRAPLDVADGAEVVADGAKVVVETSPAPAPSQFVVGKIVGPAAGVEV